jgi:hypothetical protein
MVEAEALLRILAEADPTVAAVGEAVTLEAAILEAAILEAVDIAKNYEAGDISPAF